MQNAETSHLIIALPHKIYNSLHLHNIYQLSSYYNINTFKIIKCWLASLNFNLFFILSLIAIPNQYTGCHFRRLKIKRYTGPHPRYTNSIYVYVVAKLLIPHQLMKKVEMHINVLALTMHYQVLSKLSRTDCDAFFMWAS